MRRLKVEQPPRAKEQTRNAAGFTIQESGARAVRLSATGQLLPSRLRTIMESHERLHSGSRGLRARRVSVGVQASVRPFPIGWTMLVNRSIGSQVVETVSCKYARHSARSMILRPSSGNSKSTDTSA